MFKSTKTYGSEMGFSVALRNHRARNDNCELLHGYALGFKFVFSCASLDTRGWVVDFGGLRSLKEELAHNFDHTTLIAQDDPELETFKLLHEKKVLKLNILTGVSCEELAKEVYELTRYWLDNNGYRIVTLDSVEVSEHGANSALFVKPDGVDVSRGTPVTSAYDLSKSPGLRIRTKEAPEDRSIDSWL